MGENEEIEAAAMLQGQANIWKYVYGSMESMALKCAVELHIVDIIHSHGCTATLSQIASGINPECLDIGSLARIMRFLVHRKIVDANTEFNDTGQETLYSLNYSSKWLLCDSELSLAPILLMRHHPYILSPLQLLSSSVKQGGTSFHKYHGVEMWGFASINPEFNRIFNEAMASTARITAKAVTSVYKDGFSGIGSLVDVGGGTGAMIAEIVKVYPHIKATLFDLPHVVANAPLYPGVTRVGGSMFEAIPSADAVLIKSVMHDWGDEDCVKILKNCRKAIAEKSGKVIIIEVVLRPGSDELLDRSRMVLDLVMLSHYSVGKERTEIEWKQLLDEAGFPCYNVIKLPALQSII